MFIIIPIGSTQTKYTLTQNNLQDLVEPEIDLLVGGNPDGFYIAKSVFRPLWIPISNYKKSKGGILSYLDIQYNITPYIHKLFIKKDITHEQLIQYLKQNPDKTFSHFWFELSSTFYNMVKIAMIFCFLLIFSFIAYGVKELRQDTTMATILLVLVNVAMCAVVVLPFWIVKRIFQISVNKQIETILTF